MNIKTFRTLVIGMVIGGLFMLFCLNNGAGTASVGAQKQASFNPADTYMVNNTDATKSDVGVVEQVLTNYVDLGVSLVKVNTGTNDIARYAWMAETPTNGMPVKLVRLFMRDETPLSGVSRPEDRSLLAVPIRYEGGF